MVSNQPDALRTGMVAPVSVTVLERAGTGTGTSADTTGLQAARAAPGLDPVRLASAWNISAVQAQQLLTGQGDAAPAAAPPQSNAGLLAAREQMAATEGRRP